MAERILLLVRGNSMGILREKSKQGTLTARKKTLAEVQREGILRIPLGGANWPGWCGFQGGDPHDAGKAQGRGDCWCVNLCGMGLRFVLMGGREERLCPYSLLSSYQRKKEERRCTQRRRVSAAFNRILLEKEGSGNVKVMVTP